MCISTAPHCHTSTRAPRTAPGPTAAAVAFMVRSAPLQAPQPAPCPTVAAVALTVRAAPI